MFVPLNGRWERLTVDAFWIHTLPVIEHIVGIVTNALSILAIYLICRKTPKAGKPLAKFLLFLQVAITVNDLSWCFLFSPVLLFPLIGVICGGWLCFDDESAHFTLVSVFFTIPLVGIAIVYCLHFKYVTVIRMLRTRTITKTEIFAYRSFIFVISQSPGSFMVGIPTRTAILDYVNFEVFVVMVSSCIFLAIHPLILLSRKTTKLSAQTRVMQRNLMIVLLLQIWLPFFVIVVPLGGYASSFARFYMVPGGPSKQDPVTANCNPFLLIFLSHAFAHTVFLILTTRSYRQVFTRYFACLQRAPKEEIRVASLTNFTKISGGGSPNMNSPGR